MEKKFKPNDKICKGIYEFVQFRKGMEIDEEYLFKVMKTKIKDLKKGPCQFDRFDCFSVLHKKHFELKCRKIAYVGHMIEKDKFRALQKIKREIQGRVYYVVADPSGVYVHEINLVSEPEWYNRSCPTTSQFSNKKYVMKEVGYLNSEDAVYWDL